MWPGQPMTAHWGIPDPAAATGNEAEIRLAFADAFRMLNNRISIFVSLPIRSLDKLALQKQLESIGKTKDAGDDRRRPPPNEQAPFPLSRRLLAEALGTAILVATVVGSGIMAERLAGGNQAIALLGNTIPTGAILVVIITILGPISGAHFNPAVTLVFAGRGEFPWSEVTPYVVVQCLGGICGTVIAHLMFDLAPLAIGTTTRSGPSQWLAEAVATFTLVAGDPRRHPIRAAGDPVAGGPHHHRRLLVHGIDLVRQSGGDAGARIHDDLRWNRDQSRAGFHRRAIGRRCDRWVRGVGLVQTGDAGESGRSKQRESTTRMPI